MTMNLSNGICELMTNILTLAVGADEIEGELEGLLLIYKV